MSNILWNPWHGCHKCSPGCLHCYVYYLDGKRDRDASVVVKSKTNFDFPLKKDRKGNFKISSGEEVATCFTSDFFLEEADAWRRDAWNIIKSRSDVTFLICTKRVERFYESLPDDWGSGYPNVILAVTCENQSMADKRIPILLDLPVKRKYVFVAPILEYVNLNSYLETGKINLVSVGGESYEHARVCDFDWVKKIYLDCKKHHVPFDFHQTGSNFLMNDRTYSIPHHEEYLQAKKGMEYLNKMN